MMQLLKWGAKEIEQLLVDGGDWFDAPGGQWLALTSHGQVHLYRGLSGLCRQVSQHTSGNQYCCAQFFCIYLIAVYEITGKQFACIGMWY